MKNLAPKAVWEHFYSLTQIPRPSGKKEEVSASLAETSSFLPDGRGIWSRDHCGYHR